MTSTQNEVPLMQDNYHTNDIYDNDASETETEKGSHRRSSFSKAESELCHLVQQSPKKIELHLQPLTPFMIPTTDPSPPIPPSQAEQHSTMLSNRYLPLPQLHGSPRVKEEPHPTPMLSMSSLEIPAHDSAVELPPLLQGECCFRLFHGLRLNECASHDVKDRQTSLFRID